MEILARRALDDVATVFVGRPTGATAPVEFVDGLASPLPRDEKWVINVSTQQGCPIGCRFCDAGGFFAGQLDADQILEQVRFVADLHADVVPVCRKLKVHFSRMGEPSLNPAVLDALDRLPDIFGNPNFWACVSTVGPMGADSWFEDLAARQRDSYAGRFQLQFSVNSTDQSARQNLMPYPLKDLRWIAARGPRHFAPGDRKVVLNFALAEGLPFEPHAIETLFDPAVFAVKLTPLNPTDRSCRSGLNTIMRTPKEGDLSSRIQQLREFGYDVVLSVGDVREDEVGSNCGQSVQRLAALTADDQTPRR